jgi:hypothetical protein
MREEAKDVDPARRLKIYAALTLLLILAAAVSFLLAPESGGGSLSSCDRLILSGSRYTCIMALALSQENASLCGGLGGAYADSCYSQVAEKSGNARACGDVQNTTEASLCFSSIASAENNYTLCSSAQEPYASACQSGVAVRLGDYSLCGQISNYTYGSECSSIISTRYAVRTGDAAFCANASASNDRNLTDYVIANLSANSTIGSLQSNFLLSSLSVLPNVVYTARDYCYIVLASKTLNPALCAYVSPGETATICGREAGAAANTTSSTTQNLTELLRSCSQAGNYAQQCQQAIVLSKALSTKNATLCTMLSGQQETSCYDLLASTYANSTYCDYISGQGAQSSCISNS